MSTVITSMETTGINLSHGVKRFFASLYSSGNEDGRPSDATPRVAVSTETASKSATRVSLIADVSQFFLDYEVHITGRRFMLVHDMLTGADGDLAKRFQARLKSGMPIDDAWLEALENHQAREQTAKFYKLVDEFEAQLGCYRDQTRSARETTENYGDEIAAQLDGTKPQTTGLADLAEKLLNQSRDLTAALRRNETDTDKLQRRLAKAKLEAQTDQLTGLPNRRAFEDQFALQCQLAHESGQPFCLAFCDIDNFKQVNDRHGHDTGDRVLKMVGDVLAHLSDRGSFVSRHGGEEFVVLFNNMSLDKATARLDKARRELAAKDLRNRDTTVPIGRISFSAGIASVMEYENPRDALQAADAALYRAKGQGKNQIVQA